MRIMKYSAVAMGMTMLFLAGVVTLAIHAPVRTTSQGWTTTVTVENPNDPGDQERLDSAARRTRDGGPSALKRTRTMRRAVPSTGRRVPARQAQRNFGTFGPKTRSQGMRPFRDPLLLLLFATAAATAFFAVYVTM